MKASTQTVQVPTKSIKDVVTQLQAAAKTSPVFNAVCYIFAIRERARQQVMVNTLQARMAKEGFNYNLDELMGVLKTLAGLGLGRLHHDSKGKILGLKEIKHTLQSIGLAAISKSDSIQNFRPSTSFAKLPVAEASTAKVQAVVAAPLRRPLPVVMTVTIDGKPVVFEAPHGISPEDLASLLSRLYSSK